MIKHIGFKSGFWIVFLCVMTLGTVLNTEKAVAAEDPVVMLKGATDRLMEVLRQNQAVLKSNPSRIYGIVNQYILPYVDFEEMSKWVVGRNAWNEASPQVRNDFIKEFRTMVVNAYAKSLLSYSDQTIEFLPGRQSSDSRIQVSSVIKKPGQGDLRIDYRLVQSGGSWKVYDIIIEGVSLMQGYRAQFAEDVNSGGVEAVLETIQQHNSSKRDKQ